MLGPAFYRFSVSGAYKTRRECEIPFWDVAYRHGQEARLFVLEVEVLVGERLGAVDAGRAGAVSVEEVAALAHEAGDL